MGEPEDRCDVVKMVVVGGWWLGWRVLIGRLFWFPGLDVVATRLRRGEEGRVQYTGLHIN